MATLVAGDNEGGAGHIIARVLVASIESISCPDRVCGQLNR